MGKFMIAAIGSALVFVSAIAVRTPAARQDITSPAPAAQIPPGYRDWKMISVAQEDGSLNDIRAVLGNEAAIEGFREAKLLLPDGAIIARIAWAHVPSEENNKVFGNPQSFVPGSPTNVQFMFKDAKQYGATGGWGFLQFDTHGKPADEAVLKTCFPCHAKAARDLVFARYAP